MVFYGPWLDGGTFTVTVGYGAVAGTPERGIDFAFPDACESTGAGSGGTFLDTFDPTLFGTGVLISAGGSTPNGYEASQVVAEIQQTPLRTYIAAGDLAAYTGPVPARATLQYDDGATGTTIPQYTISDSTVAADVPLNPTSDARLHPLAGTLDIRAAFSTESWVPGATLATRALLASAAASGALDETASVSFAIAEADWVLAGGIMQRTVVFASRAQITHATPTGGTAGALEEGWACYFGDPTSVTVTATVRRSRYRFVYDVLPPLRQYPRDDFLGGAPRQAKGSTSIQASTRQGWKNTYR